MDELPFYGRGKLKNKNVSRQHPFVCITCKHTHQNDTNAVEEIANSDSFFLTLPDFFFDL